MRCAGISIFATVMLAPLVAQDSNCGKIAAIAAMARATSSNALLKAQTRAGNSFRSSLIFAYRSFQLDAGNRVAARRLLSMIPSDQTQQTALMTLGDSLCDAESLADMGSLARVKDDFAREIAKAVLVAPDFMPAFVKYSLTAVQDPHSDYAVRMAKVCQLDGTNFRRAVRQLSEADQAWLSKRIIDLNGCRALTLPESDQ